MNNPEKPSPRAYRLNDFCREVGKPHFFIKNIQQKLGLHVPSKLDGYSEAYACFMRKIISLRTLSVSFEAIQDCFKKELKILSLLHLDSLSTSPTWYLDACKDMSGNPCTLLLTGFDVGFPIDKGHIQCNLDFKTRNAELFDGREMGEDVRRVIDEYVKRVESIRERAYAEMPVLEHALVWLEEAFR